MPKFIEITSTPIAWSGLPAGNVIQIPQGSFADLKTYCVSSAGYAVLFSQVAGSLETGVVLSPNGIINASASAVVGALAGQQFLGDDQHGDSALSPSITIQIVASSATLITVQQGEMYSIGKLMGLTPVGIPPSFSIAGILPANSAFGTASDGNAGLFFAYARLGAIETLATTGTYPGIVVTSGTTSLACTIVVTPAQSPGFALTRSGSIIATKYKLPSLSSQQGFAQADGDIINVQPRTFYGPDDFSYSMGNVQGSGLPSILKSLTIQSATPGVRWTIDASDSPNHFAGDLLGIFTGFSGTTLQTVNLSDFNLIGSPSPANGQADDPCCLHSRLGGTRSISLTASNFSAKNANSGVSINGPQAADSSRWSSDTTSATLINGELTLNGSAAGPGHNAYFSHPASLYMQGCNSHDLRVEIVGHLLKTKAKQSTIIANGFFDTNGAASFALDFSNWGDAIVQGNVIVRNPVNPTVVTLAGSASGNGFNIITGREWEGWLTSDGRTTRGRFYQNTIVNYRSDGVFFEPGTCGFLLGSDQNGQVSLRVSFVSDGSAPGSPRTYYVKVANDVGGADYASGEFGPITVPGGQLMVLTKTTVTGYSGWWAYVGTTSGSEISQTTSLIAFGSSWTEPTSGITTSGAAPRPLLHMGAWVAAIQNGSLSQRTVALQYTYQCARGECLPSGLSSWIVPANYTLLVSSPFAATGATGWTPYAGATTTKTQSAALSLGAMWSEASTGYTTSGTAAATTGNANMIYPDPNWVFDVQDNILAGPNAPSCTSTDGTCTVSQTTSPLGGVWRVTVAPNTNVVVATTTGQFATIFNNPSSNDFSLSSIGLAQISNNTVQGTETPATLAFTYPLGTTPRTDNAKGAYIVGLPFWATTTRLPAGTWEEIPESNVVNNLHQAGGATKSGVVVPGAYVGTWGGDMGELISVWSGGDFVDDYSTYGGYVCTGNGHSQNGITSLLMNMVVVWDGNTAQWSIVVPAYFDPSATGNALPSAHVSPGNPAGTLNWDNAAWTLAGAQSNSDLLARGEMDIGVPCASHTYANAIALPASCGGGTKGSLALTSKFGIWQNPGASYYPNRADLTSGTWQRWASTQAWQGSGDGRTCSCLDTRRKKVYTVPANANALSWFKQDGTTVGFGVGLFMTDVDPASSTYLQQFRSPCNSFASGTMNFLQNGLVFAQHPTDPTQDMVILFNGTALWYIFASDLVAGSFPISSSNFTAAFSANTATYTGTAPPATGGVENPEYHGFRWCPDTSSIWSIDCSTTPSQFTMYELTLPPKFLNGTSVRSDLTAGWVWTAYPMTRLNTSGGGNGPYPTHATQNPGTNAGTSVGASGIFTRLMYAKKAKCFLLTTSESTKMYALRPRTGFA